MKKEKKVLFVLCILIGALLTLVSGTGFLVPETYEAETPAWKIQCTGQDLVNLVLILPAFLVASVLQLNGRSRWRHLWPGIVLYLLYTFAIYAFAVHFNGFFIEYCLLLGLSFYALLVYIFRIQAQETVLVSPGLFLTRFAAAYFILTALIFYMLWLTELIPAIRSRHAPAGLTGTGLLTNPVHVLDLSIVLPAFFIAGILLAQNKKAALQWVPSFLMFMFLMDATIAALNLLMKGENAISIAFVALAAFSLSLLLLFIKPLSGRVFQH